MNIKRDIIFYLILTIILLMIGLLVNFTSNTKQQYQSVATQTIAELNETPTYWVTTKTEVIHNKNCQWFRISKGYETDNPIGRNCQNCGGKN